MVRAEGGGGGEGGEEVREAVEGADEVGIGGVVCGGGDVVAALGGLGAGGWSEGCVLGWDGKG